LTVPPLYPLPSAYGIESRRQVQPGKLGLSPLISTPLHPNPAGSVFVLWSPMNQFEMRLRWTGPDSPSPGGCRNPVPLCIDFIARRPCVQTSIAQRQAVVIRTGGCDGGEGSCFATWSRSALVAMRKSKRAKEINRWLWCLYVYA
jgi:hypothetical protein